MLGSSSTSFIVGPESMNQFPAAANSVPFMYQGLFDADRLTGTITFSFLQDGTTTPKFFGTMLVNSVAHAVSLFLTRAELLHHVPSRRSPASIS